MHQKKTEKVGLKDLHRKGEGAAIAGRRNFELDGRGGTPCGCSASGTLAELSANHIDGVLSNSINTAQLSQVMG